MARTIRRTPVVYNIPSNPRYEHLNILNFKGLSISENPLTQDPSSASDLLNLYVDINGVLTTRPRTEKHVGLMPEDATELINMYPLEDGVLVQGWKDIDDDNDIVSLWIYKEGIEKFEGKEVDIGEMTIPKEKLSVFEKDDKIYILAGDNYYYIKTEKVDDIITGYDLIDVYNDDDTYIPTTHIGYVIPDNQVFEIKEGDISVNDNIVKRPHEPRNILTNKYKEKYIWNDNFDFTQISGEYELEGYQLNNIDFDDVSGWTDSSEPTEYIQTLQGDDVLIVQQPDYTDKATISIFNTTGKMYRKKYIIFKTNEHVVAVSENGEHFVTYITGGSNIYIYSKDGSLYRTIFIDGEIVEKVHVNRQVHISNDGKTVKLIKYKASDLVFMNIEISASGETIITKVIPELDMSTMIKCSNTVEDVLFINNDVDDFHIIRYADLKTTPSKVWDIIFKVSNNLDPLNDVRYEYLTIRNDYLLMVYNDGNTINYIELDDDMDLSVDLLNSNKIIISDCDFSKTYMVNDSNTVGVISTIKDGHSDIVTTYKGDISNNNLFKLLVDIRIDDIDDDNYHITTLSNNLNNVLYASSRYVSEFDSMIGYYKLGVIGLNGDVTSIVTTNEYEDTIPFNIDNHIRFKNNYWMYGDSNRIYYTNYNDPTYIPENNYNDFGEEFSRITGLNLASYDILLVYKKNRFWIVFEDDSGLLRFNESKADNGNVPIGAQIITPLSESIVHINDEGFYAVRQLENIQSSDRSAINISLQISPKFSKEDIRNMISVNHIYWTYFAIPEKNKTKIYVLDDRSGEWYYWEINKKITNMWVADNELFFSSDDWWVYSLQTSDIRFTVDDLPEDFDDSFELYEYFDDGREVINWKWTSQIMSMKTINYIKQLMTTSFIVADNEDKDSYGLNYKFKVFRKLASETADFTIEDRLDYVANVTKKTHISRFNFLQMELSNIPGSLDHNKLKLIGLAFKYRYLEGSV